MKAVKTLLPSLVMLALGFAACETKPKETTSATAQDSVSAASAPTEKPSARPVHWGYTGEAGPETWGSLTPVYAACGNGRAQSPINLTPSKPGGTPNWTMEYNTTGLHIAHNQHVDDIVDNGHTIQVNVDSGNTITLNGKVFALKQFHFHTPSEHTLNGKHFPMETHFVHQAADGSFAVVGVFVEEGKANANFAQIIKNLPDAPGETNRLADTRLDLTLHVPKNIHAFHYKGSLTTPPCSENVDWLVLRERISMSADQIKLFTDRLKNNNRPVQTLNDRAITMDEIKK